MIGLPPFFTRCAGCSFCPHDGYRHSSNAAFGTGRPAGSWQRSNRDPSVRRPRRCSAGAGRRASSATAVTASSSPQGAAWPHLGIADGEGFLGVSAKQTSGSEGRRTQISIPSHPFAPLGSCGLGGPLEILPPLHHIQSAAGAPSNPRRLFLAGPDSGGLPLIPAPPPRRDVNPMCFKKIVDYHNLVRIAPPDDPPDLPEVAPAGPALRLLRLRRPSVSLCIPFELCPVLHFAPIFFSSTFSNYKFYIFYAVFQIHIPIFFLQHTSKTNKRTTEGRPSPKSRKRCGQVAGGDATEVGGSAIRSFFQTVPLLKCFS